MRVWTGFLALADKDGVVEGSIPGLANVMRVTDDELREILAKFQAPDPDSRSKEHEGRRIEEIPGGWRILNHGPYRRKAEAGEGSRAPYYREYRARKRAAALKYAKEHHGLLPEEEQPREGEKTNGRCVECGAEAECVFQGVLYCPEHAPEDDGGPV